MTEATRLLADIPLFDEWDRRFAGLMDRLNEGRQEDCRTLTLGAALVSRFSREGHICFDYTEAVPLLEKTGGTIFLPDREDWERALAGSSLVGFPGDYKPLIRDRRGRIYLYRYWRYQKQIADFIRERMENRPEIKEALLIDSFSRLFPKETFEAPEPSGVDKMQARAAFSAVTHSFCVISGGPGTGKTTTIARILALLVEQHPASGLRIALTAPTGKAAARLAGAVVTAKRRLNCVSAVREAIPETAFTLHRLLGSRPGSVYFRHSADNRLAVDVVVVDEASMVDMALLAKLLAALPPHCRLVLVGDKDQLASVEAGSVFADICAAGNMDRFSSSFLERFVVAGIPSAESPVSGREHRNKEDCLFDDSLVQLEKNYRFDPGGGISRLSRAVREGDGAEVVSVLEARQYPDVTRISPENENWREQIWRKGYDWFLSYCSAAADIAEVFLRFERFRILCALREGPQGANTINAVIEERIKKNILTGPDAIWYPGRPVMVIRNDYHLRLFNGDVGIALKNGAGRLRVWFFDGGEIRRFHPRRLPEHETVYAMTVHKSQGTEFGRIQLILPEKDAPVVTRELLYTAVTRAANAVQIVARRDILQAAVSRRTFRMSGLAEELWNP